MKKKADQSQKELKPYEVDKLSKIPSWIIVIFLKFWAAAAAVFFIAIGGSDIGLDWDEESFESDFTLIVMIALLSAIFMNYIVKQFVRMMHNRRNNTYRYNMINSTGFMAFFLYLIYSFVLSFILYFVIVYLGLHGLVINPFGGVNYGLEPFTYGLCYIILDMLFVLIKNGIYSIILRTNYKKQMNDKTPIIIDLKNVNNGGNNEI